MPVLRGNDVVSINGSRIAQQGIGYLAANVSAAQAAEKTKANGMDEMIFAVDAGNGSTEHVLIYGDQLDFSFRNRNEVPQVTINGKKAVMLAFDDEATSGGERGWRGAKQGLSEAFETLGNIAKKTMERAPLVTGAAFLAGTGWIVVGKGAAMATLRAAAGALAKPVAITGLATLGIGALVILANGLIKGLTGGSEPKMESLASVMSDKATPSTSQAPAANAGNPAPSSNLARRPLRVGN